MAKKRHLVYLDSKQENFLNEIIEKKNLEALDSTSKLMRFIIEDYHKLITKGSTPDVRLNYISKEISMILNLVVSMCNGLDITMQTNENTVQFWKAHYAVERVINESKANKGYRRKKQPSPAIREKLREKVIDKSHYELFNTNTTEVDQNLKTEQEEPQLKFEVPDFLKPYEEKETSSDDYVEVTAANWSEAKY